MAANTPGTENSRKRKLKFQGVKWPRSYYNFRLKGAKKL